MTTEKPPETKYLHMAQTGTLLERDCCDCEDERIGPVGAAKLSIFCLVLGVLLGAWAARGVL